MGTRTVSTGQLAPDRGTLLTWAAVLNGELVLVLLYFALSSSTPGDVLWLAYPFVWLNVAAWGVRRVGVPSASRRQWLAAGAVGVAYFLLLGGVGGLYMFHGADLGSRIAWLSPGWGPALVYSGPTVTVSLLPFKVGGYAALAYLVAVTVVDTARTGLAGFLGLLSCVSCTWPVLATLATGLFGSASTAVVVAESQPYALSTAVFVSSVLLLVWRPSR
ncbi:DUF7546 family protein [Halobacterium jilantaiense]|uniref:Uncharacterized protein n=1 Tax=Halobacterium jilantaiense TaxID=355548 RepID=A0A1I0NEZ4_9EURY|nr:ABC transporter ATP-binding protein [Halobacterium jilantaiense]SEV99813.1 hypothetical protein SAMN04487945_0818 [Halobacterium jilantaiense]